MIEMKKGRRMNGLEIRRPILFVVTFALALVAFACGSDDASDDADAIMPPMDLRGDVFETIRSKGTLPFEGLVMGELEENHQFDGFAFNVNADSAITLVFTTACDNKSCADTNTLFLYGPSQGFQQYGDSRSHVARDIGATPNMAQIRNFPIKKKGEYLVVLGSAQGKGRGTYGLSLSCASGNCGVKCAATEVCGGSTEAEFVKVSAGSFQMGSPSNELGRDTDEGQRDVTLTFDFNIQTSEVTRGQYKALMGKDPNGISLCVSENCPVMNVSWHEALGFANALSKQSGLEACFVCDVNENSQTECTLDSKFSKPQDCTGYRLPTEAEWEISARAGTKTSFFHGNLTEADCYDRSTGEYECKWFDLLDAIGWYKDNSDDNLQKVAQKMPNSLGLFDMSGNVGEWVWDWYASEYDEAETIDPVGKPNIINRTVRGGGWDSEAKRCRSAARNYADQFSASEDVGFRVVRTL